MHDFSPHYVVVLCRQPVTSRSSSVVQSFLRDSDDEIIENGFLFAESNWTK